MQAMHYYTINEVSSLLGLTVKAVRRLVAANLLKAEKIGSSYRISVQTVEDFKKCPKGPQEQIQGELFPEFATQNPPKRPVNPKD